VKKTSLSDIAKKLNVSTSLVSFVLNGQGDEKGINTQTQKRVIAKARELNYKPNIMARGLRLGKSNTIGLIVADISNKFYAKIAKRVEEVASENNYHLIICSSDEDPEKEISLIGMLRERQVDGLIISTTQKESSTLAQLKYESFPFVLIDRKLPRLQTNFIGVDNFTGGYLATQQLIKNGYEKIALLKISPSYLSSIREREEGYKSALREHGIRVNNKFIGELSFDDLKNHVRQILSEMLHPSVGIRAIFSLNNNITTTCLEYLHELNIRIPQDIAMVSFDDIELFRLSFPTITAVSQPIEEIGEKAVNLLFEVINGELNGKTRQISLPIELIERRSCGSFLMQDPNEKKEFYNNQIYTK